MTVHRRHVQRRAVGRAVQIEPEIGHQRDRIESLVDCRVDDDAGSAGLQVTGKIRMPSVRTREAAQRSGRPG